MKVFDDPKLCQELVLTKSQSMADFLGELEGYPDLEGSIIRATKIHKVLKQMIKLEHIPLEEEFKFKDRSTKLLARWNDTLSSDGPSDDKADEKTDDKPEEPKIEEDAPTTNGEIKDTEEQAQKAEAGQAAAPEEESAAKLENKIGTTVEGEKEVEEQKPADEPEKTAVEKETDGPAIETAPAEEYKPPTEETVEDSGA